MGRKSNKRRVDGWLLIDKPSGPSSNAVVGKVRWAFNAAKAGHAGTLDPTATGLLAIALGEATKTVPYLTDAIKAYDFIIRLGQATNTDDSEGDVFETCESRPTNAEIEDHLNQFIGDIEQVPPQFSAVKVGGQRAYKLARKGKELELISRPLFVKNLEFQERIDDDHVRLRLVCGKGGYVRSIARDLGVSLGCLAHVKTLRRIWSGPFDVKDALTFDQLKNLERTAELDNFLLPLESALTDLPELHCAFDQIHLIRNGNPAKVLSSSLDYGEEAWVSCDGEPLAIGTYKAGEIHPRRVFVKDLNE